MVDLIDDIMSAALFALLLTYAITVAVTLLATEANGTINLGLFAIIGGLLHIIGQMGIYCFLSENLTSSLRENGEHFYETPWHSLHIKLQKLYILPIQQSQKKYRLTGLGIIECSLRILASVSLRQLTKKIYLH